MHRFNRFVGVLLFTMIAVMVVGPPALATDFAFEHSPNAKRVQSQHQDDLKHLLGQYEAMVADAGGRFELAAQRHIQRYRVFLQREVRDLTRDGEIKTAFKVKAMIKDTEEWPVSAPDSEGVHFLNTINLNIEGAEEATSKGVDLLVDVEKAGVLYAKQVDAAYERYAEQVDKARTTYLGLLDRVLAQEQSDGRIDAVKELMDAIEVIKALPQIQKPHAERVASETQDPNDTSGTDVQANADNQPNDNTGRLRIFDGVLDEINGPTTAPSDKGQVPWAGYYLLQYSRGGRNGVEFMMKIDANGGTLLFTSRQEQRNERNTVSIPIQVVKFDQDSVLIKHEADLIKSTNMHLITLTDGVPTSCQAWWSDHAYANHDVPSQTGKVLRMGNPDADLLGLADGVYLAKLSQNRNKANRPDNKTIQFEITVDRGHVMVSRANKGNNENAWSDFHAFILIVETQGNKLVMTYDRDEFDWDDAFVIDLSDKDSPVLDHWWRSDWRSRGEQPSATGPLVKQ